MEKRAGIRWVSRNTRLPKFRWGRFAPYSGEGGDSGGKGSFHSESVRFIESFFSSLPHNHLQAPEFSFRFPFVFILKPQNGVGTHGEWHFRVTWRPRVSTRNIDIYSWIFFILPFFKNIFVFVFLACSPSLRVITMSSEDILFFLALNSHGCFSSNQLTLIADSSLKCLLLWGRDGRFVSWSFSWLFNKICIIYRKIYLLRSS